MASANVKLAVKGVDSTGQAFKSVEWRAKAAAAKLRAMLGGALAAAGAYLSFRAVKGGIDELGKLSDIAQKTSTNVGELTQASTALSILGVNGDVDSLAKAFALMEKNTGRSGMAGFFATIDEIGKIPDAAERGKRAMAVFGRSGLDFMPLVNAARDGTDALRGVAAAMPAIPQAAADAGDEMADAMAIASQGVKSIWLQAIGAICGWFGGEYVGGVREAAALAANWLEYYARLAVRRVVGWWDRLTEPLKQFGNVVGGFLGAEGGFSVRWEQAIKVAAELKEEREIERQEDNALWDEREARWRKAYEDRRREIEQFQANYDAAAKSTRQRIALDAGTASARARPQIRNSLILGNTNEALKLSILGPQLQTERQKTNRLLEQIRDNTKTTADNTEDAEDLATV